MDKSQKKKPWKKSTIKEIIITIIVFHLILFFLGANFYRGATRNARISLAHSIQRVANEHNREASGQDVDIIITAADFISRLCPETGAFITLRGSRSVNYHKDTITRTFNFLVFSEETYMFYIDFDAIDESIRWRNFIRN